MIFRYWRATLLMISLALWLLLLAATAANTFLIPHFSEVGDLKRGCYRTDALFFYVECNGFAYDDVMGLMLTLPYLLWLSVVAFPWDLRIDIPMWFFLLFPAWYTWSRRRRT